MIGYPVEGTQDGVAIASAGIGQIVPGARLIQKDAWNHLAIQLQADGYAYFYVNRQRVAKSAIRLENPTGARWRVTVLGSGFDTELYVRNLVLWSGPRRW